MVNYQRVIFWSISGEFPGLFVASKELTTSSVDAVAK